MAYPAHILQRLYSTGFSVNWTTLHVGRTGRGTLHPLLTTTDIIDFAVEVIVKEDDPAPQVVAIAGAHRSEVEAVDEALARLASADATVRALEERKWRLVLLQILLEDLSGDPLDDLIRLLEFWAQFGYPADGPCASSYQPAPVTFYGDENYRRVLARHREWVERENKELRSAPA